MIHGRIDVQNFKTNTLCDLIHPTQLHTVRAQYGYAQPVSVCS